MTLSALTNRVLNIHPALLPKFGGRGMYGKAVHEAVVQAREGVSGASGTSSPRSVIAQRQVPVMATDTSETLGARITKVEGPLFVETLRRIIAGEIDLDEMAARSAR